MATLEEIEARAAAAADGTLLIEQATAFFRACDANCDGVLTRRELSKALLLRAEQTQSLAAALELPQLTDLLRDHAHLHAAVETMDRDGDHCVDVDEFLDFVERLDDQKREYDQDQKLKRVSPEKRKAALKKIKLEHETYCARLGFLAMRLRLAILEGVRNHGSGADSVHLAANFAAADVMATLLFHTVRWVPLSNQADVRHHPDQFVLSDGRLAPVWWAGLSEAQATGFPSNIKTGGLYAGALGAMPSFRGAPWVRVAAGGTGTGLAGAAGIAWVRRGRGNRRAVVLLGGHEVSRGAFWEGARLCADAQLRNLLAVVLYHSDEFDATVDATMAREAGRLESLGWEVGVAPDGNDCESFIAVLNETERAPRGPAAVLIRVVHGSGWTDLERRPHAVTALLRKTDKVGQITRRLDRLASGAGKIRPRKIKARAAAKTPLRSSRPSSRMAVNARAASWPASAQTPLGASRPATVDSSASTAASSAADSAAAWSDVCVDSSCHDRSTFAAAVAALRCVRDRIEAVGGRLVNIPNSEAQVATVVMNELIVCDARACPTRHVDDQGLDPLADIVVAGAPGAAVGFGLGCCSEGRRAVVIGPEDGWSSAVDAIKSAGMTLFQSIGRAHPGPRKPLPDLRAESTKKRHRAMAVDPDHLDAMREVHARRRKKPEVPEGLCSRGRLVLLGTRTGISRGATAGWGEFDFTDVALLRTVQGLVIFVPCDAFSTKCLIDLALEDSPDPPANWRFFYVRTDTTARRGGEHAVVYSGKGGEMANGFGPPWRFKIGGSNVLRRSFEDRLTLVACGPHAVAVALAAHSALLAGRGVSSKHGVAVRVVDLYCLAPVDRWTLLDCFTQTRYLITIENHGQVGGLADTVAAVCPVERRLALRGPDCLGGTDGELIRAAKLDVHSVMKSVNDILRSDLVM